MLYAHSVPDRPFDEWQTLSNHLSAVASAAAYFAAPFGASEWARVIGLLHDAGKASDAFQRRLRGGREQVDHSSAGAQLLDKRYSDFGRQLAYAVAGHHGGLPNGFDAGARASLEERLHKRVEPFDAIEGCVDIPSKEEFMAAMPAMLKEPAVVRDTHRSPYVFSFLVRTLYSSLVDADFLDTERVMSEDSAAARRVAGLTLEQMRERLRRHMDALGEVEQTPVNAARASIHDACLRAAVGPSGIYTLTLPTGSGKTLSSLAFALEHAIAHGQDRIIYAIPFTSVVEQTASVFKGLFGDDSVLEHHSSYEFHENEDGKGDEQRFVCERLSMENWDARLIVTTNVQLFESIYADKPSRCRKNHNLANSVIVLDEAQSIPDGVMEPCLAAIEELAAHYAATVVLCTATQPALDAVWPFGSRPKDIVPKEGRFSDLFEGRSRISYDGGMSVDEVARRVCEERQALCIVSTKKAASVLYDAIIGSDGADGAYHLSAMMVPAHRSEVITEIKERLAQGLTCRVISTQLIEAGVDIDFPVVYRELAGIDSIKQAAGRCNREGKGELGRVHVFDCEDTRIVGHSWLARMRSLGQMVIGYESDRGVDPFGDEGVRRFFMERYRIENTDEFGILRDFTDFDRLKSLNFPFESCGERFKLIEDEGVCVFIPWGHGGEAVLADIRAGDCGIGLMRRTQRFSVGVSPWLLRKLQERSAVTRVDGLPCWILEPREGRLEFYSAEKGLTVEDDPGLLVI